VGFRRLGVCSGVRVSGKRLAGELAAELTLLLGWIELMRKSLPMELVRVPVPGEKVRISSEKSLPEPENRVPPPMRGEAEELKFTTGLEPTELEPGDGDPSSLLLNDPRADFCITALLPLDIGRGGLPRTFFERFFTAR
jgi:hypothetical protein